MIILCVGLSGCDTTSPLSAIPNVIIYYEEGATRIFVSGSDYQYEGINITIENSTSIQNFTYGHTHMTNETEFNLEVRVLDNQSSGNDLEYQRYTYSAQITVEIKDDKTEFKIIDDHHDNEFTRESPYKTLLEKEK